MSIPSRYPFPGESAVDAADEVVECIEGKAAYLKHIRKERDRYDK
jgi:hypothetical protein